MYVQYHACANISTCITGEICSILIYSAKFPMVYRCSASLIKLRTAEHLRCMKRTVGCMRAFRTSEQRFLTAELSILIANRTIIAVGQTAL